MTTPHRLFIAATATSLLVGLTAFAARTGPTRLRGTWVLEAADRIGTDGVRRPDYGTDPKGLLMIDETGRYSLQIYRTDRPRFASGNKAQGTTEEYAAAVIGTSSHIGTITLDSTTDRVVFHIAQASWPNWDGTEQARTYELTDDRFSYQVPSAASGNGTTAISVWRRLR